MDIARITFIGCGNMGRSLIGGLLANGYPPDSLCGSDIDTENRQLTNEMHAGITVMQDNIEAIKMSDVVVLAVKPQVMKDLLIQLNETLQQERPLLISIAAGIRLVDLDRWAGGGQAIVRAMPNSPALIKTGATALIANDNVSPDQLNIAETIMRSVGLVVWLDNESLMDTVTALSGSGPAYYFLLMEIMEKAAMRLGLPQEQARILTLETALGAARIALESEHDPATLRQQVTSPGGTTEQALNILLGGGIEQLFDQALAAAKERSIELAKTLGSE